MELSVRHVIVLVVCYSFAVTAQSPDTSGTVTGTVYCGSADVPARFASLRLIALERMVHQSPGSSINTVADIMGEFRFSNVSSGRYALDAIASGCVSALRGLPNDEVVRMWTTGARSNDFDITTVSVQAGETTRTSLLLEMGAVMEGDVSFDDDLPGRQLQVNALMFSPLRGGMTSMVNRAIVGEKTDDRGHFRLAGLPGGIYTLQVQLPADKPSMANSTYYLGNTADIRVAKRLEVQAREVDAGINIVIPVRR